MTISVRTANTPPQAAAPAIATPPTIARTFRLSPQAIEYLTASSEFLGVGVAAIIDQQCKREIAHNHSGIEYARASLAACWSHRNDDSFLRATCRGALRYLRAVRAVASEV